MPAARRARGGDKMARTTRKIDEDVRRVVSSSGNVWIVVFKREHNDRNGNPRYTARLIARSFKDCPTNGYYELIAPVFTFTGHYCTLLEEAEWIVNRYEEGEI